MFKTLEPKAESSLVTWHLWASVTSSQMVEITDSRKCHVTNKFSVFKTSSSDWEWFYFKVPSVKSEWILHQIINCKKFFWWRKPFWRWIWYQQRSCILLARAWKKCLWNDVWHIPSNNRSLQRWWIELCHQSPDQINLLHHQQSQQNLLWSKFLNIISIYLGDKWEQV